MDINQLWVTHNHLRHKDDLHEMVSYVAKGGLWSKECLEKYSRFQKLDKVSPLIQLSRFDDGETFIHDGHHRVVSTYIAGRYILFSDEYEITDWNYSDYLEINHSNGWYTPFDPRIHTRTPEFASFKKLAKQKFSVDLIEANKWVMENTSLFREPRRFKSVAELANSVYSHFSTPSSQ